MRVSLAMYAVGLAVVAVGTGFAVSSADMDEYEKLMQTSDELMRQPETQRRSEDELRTRRELDECKGWFYNCAEHDTLQKKHDRAFKRIQVSARRCRLPFAPTSGTACTADLVLSGRAHRLRAIPWRRQPRPACAARAEQAE